MTLRELTATVERLKRNIKDRQPATHEKATVHPDSWDAFKAWLLDRQGVQKADKPSYLWDCSCNIYRDELTPLGIVRFHVRGGGVEDIRL